MESGFKTEPLHGCLEHMVNIYGHASLEAVAFPGKKKHNEHIFIKQLQ